MLVCLQGHAEIVRMLAKDERTGAEKAIVNGLTPLLVAAGQVRTFKKKKRRRDIDRTLGRGMITCADFPFFCVCVCFCLTPDSAACFAAGSRGLRVGAS